jgi:hypothetical protein
VGLTEGSGDSVSVGDGDADGAVVGDVVDGFAPGAAADPHAVTSAATRTGATMRDRLDIRRS